TIRTGGESFVPTLAINVAILLALVSIGFLVYFIHHIASSIQAPTMISGITQETIESVRNLFPPGKEQRQEAQPTSEWVVLNARQTGYLQHIGNNLVQLADQYDFVVRIERRVGEFIVEGTPLLAVRGGAPMTSDLEGKLLATIGIDSFRTVEQDPGYGIRQLVDIAIKALSPGVNDTSTAINCIDYIGAILHVLVQREPMLGAIESKGKVRVIYTHCIKVERLIDLAFLQIRQSGSGNTAVLLRVLKVIRATSEVAHHELHKQLLTKHLSLVEEMTVESISSPHDKGIVLERLEGIRRSMG
ncbi:MAG: DUF2254 domain-containing protein, partial [Limisphaerales bacterium]